jgi:hypothetical protein
MQVIEAKTPAPVIGFEGEDARVDARYELLISSLWYVFLTTWQDAQRRQSQTEKYAIILFSAG